MRLKLNDIIGIPGAKKPFAFSLLFPDPVACTMCGPSTISGTVFNIAGALEIRGEAQIAMTCTCDRCMASFLVERTLPVVAYLAEELTDESNPDIFLIEDGAIDLEEVFTTAFFLDMESKIVCKEDCLGLCTTCGADLNQDPCACKQDIDPRLAALQQFLDKE